MIDFKLCLRRMTIYIYLKQKLLNIVLAIHKLKDSTAYFSNIQMLKYINLICQLNCILGHIFYYCYYSEIDYHLFNLWTHQKHTRAIFLRSPILSCLFVFKSLLFICPGSIPWTLRRHIYISKYIIYTLCFMKLYFIIKLRAVTFIFLRFYDLKCFWRIANYYDYLIFVYFSVSYWKFDEFYFIYCLTCQL